MSNPNWPLTVTSVAFTTDPFNVTATPLYMDISERVWDLSTTRGRQYELDVVQAGTASITLADRDEAFNPGNTAGPYYPHVKVYRQITDQAMWPPAPSTGGVATNLLNVTSGRDGSFESYPVTDPQTGPPPAWISNITSRAFLILSSPA